jgi:hypothetical protein
MVKKYLIILFFTFSFGSLFAQEIIVTASTDTTDYLIGDHIKYNLQIKTSKDVYIINPFFRDSLKNIDLINISDPVIKEDKNGKTINYYCGLTRLDSAQITIPAIRIEYRTQNDTILKSALSNSVTINIHRMDVSMQEDIKDIKPPIRPFDFTFLIYIILAATIISLLVYYFIYKKYWKRENKIEIKKKEEKLLSHQLALKKLLQLENEQVWQKGFVKEYHTRITEIIREYFEKQFELPLLELTTTESIQLLRKHPQGIKVIDITSQFLSNADLVKFAKYIPIEIINFEMMNQAKEIIKTTVVISEESKVEEAANV